MTITYEHSVRIERPVEDVYAYVMDVSNAPAWMPWVDEVAIDNDVEPDGIAVGQRRRLKQTDFGIQSETVIEAVAVDPARYVEFKTVRGPVDFSGTYRFEDEGGATTLTRSYRVELDGIRSLLESFVEKRMLARWDADMERLKAVLETDADREQRSDEPQVIG